MRYNLQKATPRIRDCGTLVGNPYDQTAPRPLSARLQRVGPALLSALLSGCLHVHQAPAKPPTAAPVPHKAASTEYLTTMDGLPLLTAAQEHEIDVYEKGVHDGKEQEQWTAYLASRKIKALPRALPTLGGTAVEDPCPRCSCNLAALIGALAGVCVGFFIGAYVEAVAS